jgi:hypothetical protein
MHVLHFRFKNNTEEPNTFRKLVSVCTYLQFVAFCLNLLVTRCTNKFNIQQLYVLPTLYLCVL